MKFWLFLLPFIEGGLLSIIFYLGIKIFLFKKVNATSIKKELVNKILQSDLSVGIEPLLDKRLDLVVENFKQEIPMASMFLSGALANKFKNKGKSEILKMLPEVKTFLIEKFLQDFELDTLMPSPSTLAKKMAFCGAILGFILGAIHVGIIAIIC